MRTLAIALMFVVAAPAFAAYDLQITEMWMGNEPGSNLTEDWFEITNSGDMPWTAATDGDIWYDDDSPDVEAADIIFGIASIAPGETVVLVDEGLTGLAGWSGVWGADITIDFQVGYYDGSGLGQGGDGVALFVGTTGGDIIDGNDLLQLDFETYPDANANGGQSYDTVLGAFSTVGNASGAIATSALNDENQPAIASPGSVPEPASLGLLLIGGGLALARRRR